MACFVACFRMFDIPIVYNLSGLVPKEAGRIAVSSSLQKAKGGQIDPHAVSIYY
jgi:hypothetical protein